MKSPVKYLTLLLAVALLQFLNTVDFCYDFDVFLITVVVIFVATPLLLILGVKNLLQKRRDKSFKFLSIMIGIILGLITGGQFNKAMKEMTLENGAIIVIAIDRFYKQNHHYPKSLQELKPDFLHNIPQPSLGLFSSHSFRYKEIHDEKFSLEFFSPGLRAMAYNKQKKLWEQVDKH